MTVTLLPSTKEQTETLLRPRRWITGAKLEAQGGSLRRLRELRDEGWDIKKRRIAGTNAYEYRLVARS